MLVAELRETPGVVLREEVGDEAAEVLEKPLAFVHAPHHAPREHGQVGQGRIPHARLERLLHPLRPVLGADLVTVDEDVVEAAVDGACKRAEAVAEARHVLVEVVVHRGGGELVHLQPRAMFGRGVIAAAVADVPDAQENPVARRHVPRERAVRRHAGGEVNDSIPAHNLAGEGFRGIPRHAAPDVERLGDDVRQPQLRLWHRLFDLNGDRCVDGKPDGARRQGLGEGVVPKGVVAGAGKRQRHRERLKGFEGRPVPRNLHARLRGLGPHPRIGKAERHPRRRERLRRRQRDRLVPDGCRHVRERHHVRRRGGEGKHGDVLVESVVALRARKLVAE